MLCLMMLLFEHVNMVIMKFTQWYNYIDYSEYCSPQL